MKYQLSLKYKKVKGYIKYVQGEN